MNDLKQYQVLLIEDNSGDARLIAEYLKEAAASTITLTIKENLGSGIEYLSSHYVDAILLDLSLPDSFGPQTFHKLYTQFASIPIIILTGLDDKDFALSMMQQGAQDYLPKNQINPELISRTILYSIERNQTNEKLKKASDHWSSTFNAIQDGVILLDKDQNIIESNQTFLDYTKKTREEIIGKACYSIVHGTECPIKNCPFSKADKSNKRESFELRVDERLYEVMVDPILDENGNLGGAVHIIADITERKRIERANIESEKLFSITFHSLPTPVSLSDISTNTWIEVNEAFLKTTGYKRHEIVGHTFQQINLWKDPAKRDEMTQMLLEKKRVEDFEVEINKKDGSSGTMLISVEIVQLTALPYLLIMGKEITEQKKAELAIKESEARYRELFENSMMAISVTDTDGYLTHVNRAYAQMYGYESPEEMIELKINVEQLYANPKDRAKVVEIIEEKGFMDPREVEVIRRDGTRFFVLVSAMVIKDAFGNPLRYQANHIDITERKQSEKTLNDLIEKNPMSIQVMNQESFTLKTNPANTLLFGVPPPPDFSIFNDLQNKGFGEYVLLAKKGEVVHFPDIYYNVHDVFPEMPDKPVWVRAVLFPLTDSVGKIERFVFMHEDITERKKAEVALLESESSLNYAQQIAKMGSWDWDINTNKVSWSENYFNFFGLDSNKIEPSFELFKSLVHPDDVQILDEKLAYIMDNKEAFSYDLRILHPDGTINWIYNNVIPVIEDDKIVKLKGAFIDITEIKNAEEELTLTLEQLRQLHQHVETAIEKERKAISRELHDGLGQMLTAVKMDLGYIKNHVAEPVGLLKIDSVSALVSETIKTVQKLTSQLRPQSIDDLGLIGTLKIYISDYQDRFEINVVLEANDNLELKSDISVIIYRIVLESLTNIARHSKAKKVLIKIRKKHNEVFVSIADNGIGITEKQINAKDSFGIISMKERAASVGGTFTIGNRTEGGTLTELCFALDE